MYIENILNLAHTAQRAGTSAEQREFERTFGQTNQQDSQHTNNTTIKMYICIDVISQVVI